MTVHKSIQNINWHCWWKIKVHTLSTKHSNLFSRNVQAPNVISLSVFLNWCHHIIRAMTLACLIDICLHGLHVHYCVWCGYRWLGAHLPNGQDENRTKSLGCTEIPAVLWLPAHCQGSATFWHNGTCKWSLTFCGDGRVVVGGKSDCVSLFVDLLVIGRFAERTVHLPSSTQVCMLTQREGIEKKHWS